MHTLQYIRFNVLFIILLSTFSQASIIDISFPKAKQIDDNGVVRLSIKNTSNNDIKILKWNTPLEDTISADLFHVKHNKEYIPYIGRLVKRSNPTEDDYMTLEVGETRIITINLPTYYQITKQGKYTITYNGSFRFKSILDKEKTFQIFKVSDKNITIFYTPIEKKNNLNSQKVIANFNSCTQSQTSDLNLAHDNAINLTQESLNTLSSYNPSTSAERYRTWFGAKNIERYNTVKTHYTNIYNVLDKKQIIFDCSCNENYFAYVYDTQPYTIYICNKFWEAPSVGTDSQAGTLIHEIAHFNIVANTDDFVYGHQKSKTLAILNPNNAIYNSDNHEYFSENTPNLTMSDIFINAIHINLTDTLPLSESIDNTYEKDMFTFTVPTSGIYTFYSSGTLDTQGTLYNIYDENIAFNDDISSNDGNYNFSLKYYLISGNRYYISVNAFKTDTGAYTLNVISPSINDTTNIENFVSRFYTKVLARSVDQNGLNYWVNKLSSGEKVGADVAKEFIFSQEFISHQVDNDNFLTILYKAFFDRDPDNNGFNIWLNKLNTGATREEILNGFLFSQEFKTLTHSFGIQANRDVKGFVERFYQSILNRIADEDGLTNWTTNLISQVQVGADIANGFIFSEEYINKNTDHINFVTTLYQAFFGRNPDSSGLKIWMDKLNQGSDRHDIVNGFLYSQEFNNLCQSYGIIPVR